MNFVTNLKVHLYIGIEKEITKPNSKRHVKGMAFPGELSLAKTDYKFKIKSRNINDISGQKTLKRGRNKTD